MASVAQGGRSDPLSGPRRRAVSPAARSYKRLAQPSHSRGEGPAGPAGVARRHNHQQAGPGHWLPGVRSPSPLHPGLRSQGQCSPLSRSGPCAEPWGPQGVLGAGAHTRL